MKTFRRLIQYFFAVFIVGVLVVYFNWLAGNVYELVFTNTNDGASSGRYGPLVGAFYGPAVYLSCAALLGVFLASWYGPRGHKDVSIFDVGAIISMLVMMPFAYIYSWPFIAFMYESGGLLSLILTFVVFFIYCCVGLVLRRAYLIG